MKFVPIVKRLLIEANDFYFGHKPFFTGPKRLALGSDIQPVIAMMPYPKAPHASIFLNDLDWPFGKPEFVTPKSRIYDLRNVDHVLSTASSRLFFSQLRGISAKVSLMILEPCAVNSDGYMLAISKQDIFHKILSHDKAFVKQLSNGIHLEHGRILPLPEHLEQATKKVKQISLIASEKRSTDGHRLRHQIVDMARANAISLDAMGRGYMPIEDTSTGFAPYHFSVVIENSRQPGYFTEKLVDAFLYMTLPIYWGDPDIEQVFDLRGMLICTTADEIMSQISGVNRELYTRRLPYLKQNRIRALKFVDYWTRAASKIRSSDM